MSKLILISCYFGTLPEHFPFFLKTLECNPKLDLMLVTDCDVDNAPNNLKLLKMTFSELREKIQSLYDFEITLDRPYKLCDYKPAYGEVFSKEIAEYEFWGHCDIDLLFGDVMSFLSEQVLEKYDKIYQLGHLEIFRNTEESNARYRLEGGYEYYKDVFQNKEIWAFDEIAGMQNKFNALGIPTYISRDYADITWAKVKFNLSDFCLTPEQIAVNNYDKQVFYWENGKVFRAFLQDGQIKTDEFNYIHFSKRKMPIHGDAEAYYVTNKGLFPKSGEVTAEDFDKYNSSTEKEERERTRICIKNSRREKRKYYLGLLKKKIFGTKNK